MHKILRFFQDKPFLSSFLLVLFPIALSLVLFRPYFYNIDDSLILLLLKGMGIATSPSEMVQYVNVLLCWGLSYLYQILPNLQLYSSMPLQTVPVEIKEYRSILIVGGANYELPTDEGD